MKKAIHDILQQYWGYTSFRPLQEDIITSVLNGQDTLGLLPTGGGKSITFQVPAIATLGLTIVITPLISLMKDQVDNLRQHNIPAIYIHSGLSRRESKLAIEKCQLEKVKLLYISPEKLQSPTFLDHLRLMPVQLIVVDEAHCISQWGYDFRPSYLKIKDIRKIFPNAPILALTASATPEVTKDIVTQLKFKSHNIFSRSFSRENISYIVRYGEHKDGMLLKILRAVAGSAIVYVRSRRRTREIATLLTQSGISADFYHAGLAPEDKNEKQNKWKDDTCRVMVATNAFGMGIDKPNVRTVIHYDIPSSLEEYYQEAGRAGRDGNPSYAVLLASNYDKSVLTRRISENYPDKDYIKKIYEYVSVFLDVAVGYGYNQIFEFNFNLFCKRFDLKPTMARNALILLSQAEYIEFTEEINTQSRIMILLNKEELYSLRLNDVTDNVFQTILRSYTGLFADYVYINESLIASRTNISEQEVYEALLTLSRQHVIHYIPRKTTPYIQYLSNREATKYITLPRNIYEDQRDRMTKRINAMKTFAFSQDDCRVNILLKYFGENCNDNCGQCDICRDKKNKNTPKCDYTYIRKSILYLASQPGGHTIQHIINQIKARPQEIIETIRILLDEEAITIDDDIIHT